MKKLSMIFGFAFIAAIALSSCKKDYTCECNYKDAVDGSTVNVKAEWEKISKKDAEEACDQLDATWKLVDSAAKCELK